MAKIVIIGSSAAGFSCCDTFLKNSQNNEITVVSQESYPAYRRDLLIDYLDGSIKEEELFLCSPDFYEKNRIKFLKNAKVVRVDVKKQLIILKDNNKINYDYLVIASGRKVSIPDIPGRTKDGVFAFYKLEDIKNLRQRLMLPSTICVIGEPSLCLRLCEVIAKKDKEVKVVSKPKPDAFNQSEKTEWIDHLELKELIGEGAELNAMKFNNGKVIGTPLVLFAGNYSPCSEFLKETTINLYRGYIITDDAMQTNFENIFACGSVCKNDKFLEREKSWGEALDEGALAANTIIKLLERQKTLCH